MKCTKDLSITITAPEPPEFACPDNVTETLTPASERSQTAEIDHANSPHYCVRRTQAFVTNDLVYMDVGDPGFTGALDTLAYILVQGQATAGTINTITVAGKSWTANCWAGKWICILTGPNNGQELTIVSNTGDSIEVWPDQPLAFDATTRYSIIAGYDDDSGPGANSSIHYTVPTNETYIFEGTTYAAGVTVPIEMDFTCPLTADFDWSPHCGGTVDVTDYTFSDLSLGHPTSWEWDFGDLTAHDVTQNPIHQYASEDLTSYPGMCGSRDVVLTVRRGALVATHTETLEVKRRIRIKNYLPNLFTLGADAAGCSDTGIADWDGVMNPWQWCTPCAWVAENVNVKGKLVTVGVLRADNFLCMPGQAPPPFGPLGFIFCISCGGVANWIQYSQYDYATDGIGGTNNPSGIYTLRTALNAGACWHQDYLNDPLALEIEYVP